MAKVTLASGASVEIEEILYAFVRDEAVNGTRWSADDVFRILGELVQEFDPKNRELLAKRASLQTKIDDYYIEKRRLAANCGVGSSRRDGIRPLSRGNQLPQPGNLGFIFHDHAPARLGNGPERP